MSQTATQPLGYTSPDAALALGLKPDRLYRLTKRNPDIARFFQSVGHHRLVSSRDLPKLREVLVGLGEIPAATPTPGAAAEAV